MELPSDGEVDDETLARKRARRVSFAETTNVHFFDRDEDYETPPDQTTPTDASKRLPSLAFQPGDHSDSDESKNSSMKEDDDEDDDDDEEERFVRDLDSSSPGSAAGSVTSNDDDNFFGPVSTSFIQSGRLSEAGMSDDNNHDITLDSTAFSLHFRNIAAVGDHSAYSVGSMPTPTGCGVASSSTVTPKKPVLDSSFCNKANESGATATNMSLMVDSTNKYDYEKLSPTLEKLLNEVNKSMQPISPNSGLVSTDPCSSGIAENKDSPELMRKPSNTAPTDRAIADNCFDPHLLASSSSATASKPIRNINPSPTVRASLSVDIPISEKTQDTFSADGKSLRGDHNRVVVQPEAVVSTVQNLDMLSPPYRRSDSNQPSRYYQVDDDLRKDQLSGSKHYSSILHLPSTSPSMPVVKDNQYQLLELETKMHTHKNASQYIQSPLQGSVSSLRAKRQQLILIRSVNSPSRLINSPARGNPTFSLDLELKKHSERISAIKNHMTRTRILETPVDNIYKSMTSLVDLPIVNLESALEKITVTSNGNPIHVPVLDLGANLVTPTRNDKSEFIVEAENLGLVGADSKNDEKAVDESTKSDEAMNLFDASRLEIERSRSPVACQNVTEEPCNFNEDSFPQGTVKLKQSSELSNDSGEANHHDTIPFQEVVNIQGNLSGKKRTSQDITADGDCVSKLVRKEISPEFSSEPVTVTSMISQNDRHQSCDSLHEVDENISPIKLWTDILSKVVTTVASVFSLSITTLSLQQLDVLEDILGDLQRARMYMRFCSSLKNNGNLTDLKVQRLSEAKLLQDKLLFEQAKLQLKRVKLEKLRNKAQQLQSGVQECNNLKSIFSQLFLQTVKDVQDKNLLHQEGDGLISAMKSDLELLKHKVSNVTKSLKGSCKIKEHATFDEIIEVASKHLEMKNLSRKIHEDMRLWKLSDIVKRYDKNDIVLNYCNLIFQRFIISISQVSDITVINTFNGATIEKRFPNMNSCIAFEFVFKGNMKSGLPSLSCFGQKIQETSLLMGLLVDVLEEVQAAQLKLLNLTRSSFSLQPSGGLELHLCFTNFRRGQKVTLILEMSMLNCAVYPSEPSGLKYMILGAQTTLPQIVLDRIEASVKSLQGGQRQVILRFCQTIAEAVNSSIHKAI